MRRAANNVLAILLIAGITHAAAIWLVPRLVMIRVMRTVGAHNGVNTAYNAPQATAASRSIPLPSPDLLYSTCVLDLSHGPVSVSVTPGPDYLSLAVFDAATDNVFVTSDNKAHGMPIHLLISGPATPLPVVPAGATLVRVHTARGLLLLRALAATPELQARNDAARLTLDCHQVK